MVNTGFSAVIGSWKTSATSAPRTRWISRSLSVRRSRPLKITRPLAIRPGRCTSRRMDSAVTDLPLPDSPTRPSVSPASTWKLTSITAGAGPPGRSKTVVRRSTESSRGPGTEGRGPENRSELAPRSSDLGSGRSDLGPRTSDLDSSDINLPMLPEDGAQGVRDFTNGGASFHGANHVWHQVVGAACGGLDGVQRLAPGARVPCGAQTADALDLARLDRRIDPEDVDGRVFVGRVPVYANDDGLAGVDLLLCAIRGVLDLALDEPRFDCRQRAAEAVDLLNQTLGLTLDLIGHLLDGERSAERIDRVGNAALERDDLLRPERHARGLLGRERKRFVTAVAVQRLRSAKDGRERLHGNANDIVVGLLRGQRAAGGLGVKTELLGARVRRAEPIAHQPRPQPPRGAELGDLLEKVVVRVEEERELLAEAVHRETRIDGGLHVGDRVGQRERHLLHGGGPRFANVVPADRDRVPVRKLALAIRKDVGDDSERCTRRIDVGPARDVLLQDVVLNRPGQRALPHAVLPCDGDVERQQDDGRRIDRHRRGDAVERDLREQLLHIRDGVNRNAHAPHFPLRERMV